MTPTHIADCAVASLMRMAWPFAAQEQGTLIARSNSEEDSRCERRLTAPGHSVCGEIYLAQSTCKEWANTCTVELGLENVDSILPTSIEKQYQYTCTVHGLPPGSPHGVILPYLISPQVSDPLDSLADAVGKSVCALSFSVRLAGRKPGTVLVAPKKDT